MADDEIEFSVQTYEFDRSGALQIGKPVKAMARSALEAGKTVLAEDLSIHGPTHLVRAKVWRIGDDFKPIDTLLYRSFPKQEI